MLAIWSMKILCQGMFLFIVYIAERSDGISIVCYCRCERLLREDTIRGVEELCHRFDERRIKLIDKDIWIDKTIATRWIGKSICLTEESECRWIGIEVECTLIELCSEIIIITIYRCSQIVDDRLFDLVRRFEDKYSCTTSCLIDRYGVEIGKGKLDSITTDSFECHISDAVDRSGWCGKEKSA